MGLVRMLRRILIGELRQIREVSTRSAPMPDQGARQDEARCDQGRRQNGIVLSLEQKRQLMQMIAEELESKKGKHW